MPTRRKFFVKNSSEQERGNFPSLPDTFDFWSEQPANCTNKSQKTQNEKPLTRSKTANEQQAPHMNPNGNPRRKDNTHDDDKENQNIIRSNQNKRQKKKDLAHVCTNYLNT